MDKQRNITVARVWYGLRSLTSFAVAPVVPVLGEAAEENVQDEQDDGEQGAHAERDVERLIVAGLVLAEKRVSRELVLVVQNH